MSARVLYVEDDEDLRAVMEMVLAREGYEVTTVANAEDAIVELQTRRYQLLLTDYNLPNKNADWLLQVARDGGLLQHVGSIVLTAASQPAGIDAYRILRKPVDLAVLLAALDEALAAQEHELHMQCEPPSWDGRGVVLMLYVTGTSPASKKAMRNLRRVLQDFDPDAVHLTVCDVTALGDAALASLEQDRVVVTPTLVRHRPEPKAWVIGDLSNADTVRDLIGPPRGAPARHGAPDAP